MKKKHLIGKRGWFQLYLDSWEGTSGKKFRELVERYEEKHVHYKV